MVNVIRRLARRATSSSSVAPDPGAIGPNVSSQGPALHRTTSAGSAKRARRAQAEEPSSRHLIVISDTADFDPHIMHRFQAEGFDATFIGFVCSGDSERDRKALENAVHEKEDELEAGERYAIVAYNRPAYYLLGSHHLTTSNTNPFPRLCALIAYYPLTSTDQWTRDPHPHQESCAPACSSAASIFDPGPSTTYLPIQIHLPGHEAKSCTIWPWIGVRPSEGDLTYKKRHRCHVYAYPDAKAGFAERTSDSDANKDVTDREYDRTSAQLAWSRTMGCLRRAFGVGSNWAVGDIETVWEEYWQRVLADLDGLKREQGQGPSPDSGPPSVSVSASGSGAPMEMMVSRGQKHDGSYQGRLDMHGGEGPSVECVPTKAGGSDPTSLRSFFTDTFIPNGPASQHVQLLSRTVGADQIVDEISFSFRHTAEVSWLLPNVTPTGREIQVVIVVVASFCADKIVRQSLYWDQAGVLVQAGLLDPGLVPRANVAENE